MGRQPCCDKVGLKKGPWTADEDRKLVNFISRNGHGCWRILPKLAGLLRCGKSCRLRWTNYLRPDLKRGFLTDAEEKLIIDLHAAIGNRWSRIAAHLPGRTDNEIKNYWNTRIKKKLKRMGIDPNTHRPLVSLNHEKDVNENLCNSTHSELTDDCNASLHGITSEYSDLQESAKMEEKTTFDGPIPSNVPSLEQFSVIQQSAPVGGQNCSQSGSRNSVFEPPSPTSVIRRHTQDDESEDSLITKTQTAVGRDQKSTSTKQGTHECYKSESSLGMHSPYLMTLLMFGQTSGDVQSEVDAAALWDFGIDQGSMPLEILSCSPSGSNSYSLQWGDVEVSARQWEAAAEATAHPSPHFHPEDTAEASTHLDSEEWQQQPEAYVSWINSHLTETAGASQELEKLSAILDEI